MEKVIWVTSHKGIKNTDDGLKTVNEYLEQGWKVKHISACAVGDSPSVGQAYIVIETEG